MKIKDNAKIDKYWDLARELKKTMEHNSDGNTNINCSPYPWNGQ